jgi:hypothetical protein
MNKCTDGTKGAKGAKGGRYGKLGERRESLASLKTSLSAASLKGACVSAVLLRLSEFLEDGIVPLSWFQNRKLQVIGVRTALRSPAGVCARPRCVQSTSRNTLRKAKTTGRSQTVEQTSVTKRSRFVLGGVGEGNR